MKAITIFQPWASLIALGVKTIETRSWKTNYRGPLAIHAAKTTNELEFLAGANHRTTAEQAIVDALRPYFTKWDDLPLGSVVAVANLADCIPMYEDTVDEWGLWHNEPPIEDDSFLTVGSSLMYWTPSAFGHGSAGRHITDQRPYGDFQPGRWAWLLEDIQPLPEPIPAKGEQKLWNWERA